MTAYNNRRCQDIEHVGSRNIVNVQKKIKFLTYYTFISHFFFKLLSMKTLQTNYSNKIIKKIFNLQSSIDVLFGHSYNIFIFFKVYEYSISKPFKLVTLQICQVTISISDKRRRRQHLNFRTFVACEKGYFSKNGSKCHPCTGQLYGLRCLQTCACTDHQT